MISPLLANIYLHYVFDLWAERWRRREAKGDMVIVTYADDIVVGFEYEADARRFWDAMRERLGEFALSLHPDKTRLIEFGRFAAANRERRGLGKPETFNFLGFTFICGKSRKGGFLMKRKSRGDRVRAKLKEIKEGLRQRMHQPLARQGKWLAQVVSGLVQLLRRAHQLPRARRLPLPCRRSLAAHAPAAQPERPIRRGSGCASWPTTGCPSRQFFTHGPSAASPSNTRGGSRMRESRPYGSVRGALSNERPYRDRP